MKRKITNLLVASIILWALPAGAQTFNTTLTHPDYNFFGASSIALPQPNGDIIVGSYAVDKTVNYPKLVLGRFGYTGNFQPPLLVRDSSYNIDRIMETRGVSNDGVIVVSELYDYLLVRKYTVGLSLQWSFKLLKTNPYWPHQSLSRVDIERETDAEGNDLYYYIVSSTGPNDMTYSQDHGISIAKVDVAGTLLWNKVYTDANRAQYGSMEVIQDKPTSITSFPDPTDPDKRNYAIAGVRLFYSPFQSIQTFYMTIDENGNIVAPYTKVSMDEMHYQPELLYDGDSLAISFLHANINNEPSAFAILKTDIGLNTFRGMAYTSECENYAYTISLSNSDSVHVQYDDPKTGQLTDSVIYGTDKNYLIGGWAGPCTTANPYKINPAFLKIDKLTLVPVDFKRYNVYRDARGMYHRTDVNDDNLMIASVMDYGTWNTYGLRLMRTDNLLKTCGYQDLNVVTAEINPGWEPLEYEWLEHNNWQPAEINEISSDCEVDNCQPQNNPAYYKPGATSVNTIAGNDNVKISLTPTLVQYPYETIVCNITSPAAMNITISVYNMMGQEILSESHNLQPGEQTINIHTAHIPAGINIVRVSGNNRSIAAEKIHVVR